MTFVSVTRLRIRSIWFMPLFAWDTLRSLRQVKRAVGFQEGSLLPDRRFTFWTMTAWDSRESMRRYMTSGAHKAAMPMLMKWCDEASVVHWEQADEKLPTWAEADRRMRTEGRISKVQHPSAGHAGLRYEEPRFTGSGPIRRVE